MAKLAGHGPWETVIDTSASELAPRDVLAGGGAGPELLDGVETDDGADVRRLAVLVSGLLDEIADDDHGPLPYFGAEQDVRWSA
ncbi:hypothetical protein [Streptomyces niveiscabiei]|uniref:Uncharacterized protein n=1 Tax=Streptomyces niveiscabiei TaxID=164115 RepID=A0ABW9HQ53_9ACTN